MRALKFDGEPRSHFTKPSAVEDRPNEPLFRAGPRLRRLRVMLDQDAPALAAPDERTQLLIGLLHHWSISCLRYSDGGPPAATAIVRESTFSASEGWVTVGPGSNAIAYAESGRITQSVCWASSPLRLAEGDARSSAYVGLSDADAAARRRSDVLALCAADAAQADLLISERPYLYEAGFRFKRGVQIVTPNEALATVGLYLRSQGEYWVWATPDGKGRAIFNRGLLYWVASRALLPEGWRWMTACVRHSAAAADDTLTHYAGSAHHRLAQALSSRDDLFVAMNQPQDNDTADQALHAFDSILLSLSGAMDVTARVLNVVLGHPISPKNVSWRRDPWRRELRRACPSAAQLADSPEFRGLVDILGALRNTIHGAALPPLAISGKRASVRTDTLVGLPDEDLAELLQAMDAMGGQTTWGVKQLIPGRAHADLDVLVERLFSEVTRFLNAIMKETPVEQLQGSNLTPADCLPPDDIQSPFREVNRRYILWQMGF